MSNTDLPSPSHEVMADQLDMNGTDVQDEYLGDDTVDDGAIIDNSLDAVDDDDLLIEDDDDDLLDDDDLDDDDDLLGDGDDYLVLDDEDDDDL